MNTCQHKSLGLDVGVVAQEADVTFRLATSREDLEQAFKLVRDAYVRVGLHAENSHELRMTKYHLLPSSKVFVAVAGKNDGDQREQVIGTVTVVPDGPMGLPAETVAKSDIGALRRSGSRAAEFIALAANEEGTRQRVILKLFRLAFEYCRINGINTIFASLTERHIGFYRRFLGFRPLGDLVSYEMGNGIPVQVHFIDLALDLGRIERRSVVLDRDPSWRWFWFNELDDVLRQARQEKPWSQRLIEYFYERCRDLRAQLDEHTIQLLQSEYIRHARLQESVN